jgi:hypothetical protein
MNLNEDISVMVLPLTRQLQLNTFIWKEDFELFFVLLTILLCIPFVGKKVCEIRSMLEFGQEIV